MSARVIRHKNHRIEIDTASQRLGLKMLDRTYHGADGEPQITATPREVPRSKGFVSASMLALKCKQVDDRLYAGVERAAQGGSAGKRELLLALGRRLATGPGNGAAPEVVLAAAALGGFAHPLEGMLAARVQDRIDAFLADPLRSKPIGFYSESDELTAIFRQDRMLQTPLADDPAGAALVARELHADPALRAIYERTLALFERLTNPFARHDLRPVLAAIDRGDPIAPGDCSFLPPSIAHETELIKKLYGRRPIPDGFDLADEMIRGIQRGTLSLAPRPESGWYDHQTWATEPLLLPDRTREAGRLELDDRYRKQLRELWKGIVALQRETHIKQLEFPLVGGGAHRNERPTVYVRPELTVEPTCEHYRRRVLSYRFVRTVLTEALGAARVSATLADELDAIEALCAGAYASACSQIGLAPDRDIAPDPAAAIAAFARFGDGLAGDPDLGRDTRMMVPVFYDQQRRATKVWVFLGWAADTLMVYYARQPKFQVLHDDGRPDSGRLDVNFMGETHELAFPVTAEVYVSSILDRTEFRKHCDVHRTRSAILANLR